MKTNIHRAVAAISMAGVASLVLTGCIGSGGGSAGSGDSSVIRVQALSGPIIEAVAPIADAYEEQNPGVTVELESLSNDAARQPNVATLTSSNAPDVGFVQLDSGVFQTLVNSGDLEALGEVWDTADLANQYPEAASSALESIDSERHGVLFVQALAPVVYYNTDLFDSLGIEVPEDRDLSVEDFLGAVETLAGDGKEGLGVGGNTPYHLHHLVMGMLAGAASAEEYEQYLQNWNPEVPLTTDYSSGPYLDVVETLEEWNQAGVFPQAMLSQDYTQAEAAFVGQQSGMFLGGSWTPGELYGDLDVGFNVDWFPLPSLNDSVENRPQVFSGDTFVVPKAAGNKEGAADFLEFMMTVEQQSTIAETGTLLPIFEDVPDSALEQLNPVTASLVDDAAANGSVPMWGPYLPIEIGQEFGVRQYQSLLAGSTTPQGVAAEFDRLIEELRAG